MRLEGGSEGACPRPELFGPVPVKLDEEHPARAPFDPESVSRLLAVMAGGFEHHAVQELNGRRPVLQGARLTAWELRMAGVPFTLITDNMAASIMRRGLVDAVIVGADRIAANGDVANKIGTYGLAVLARAHGIPFYVAAPSSTVDLTLASGDGIVIEERDEREVTGVTVSGVIEPRTSIETRAFDMITEAGDYALGMTKGHQMQIARKGGAYQFDAWLRIAPPSIDVYNPAFDVTPAEYVTAIITERGVARPDYALSLAEACCGTGALHELG